MSFTNFDQQLGTDSITVTDEVVKTLHSPADGGTLFTGYMCGLSDDRLLGSGDPVFGVFSAAARAGTHYQVIKEGVPSSGQVLWDQATGRLVSASAGTFYVTYPFWSRLFRFWEFGSITITPDGLVSTGSDVKVYEKALLYPERLSEGYILLPAASTGNVTLKVLKNGTPVFNAVVLTNTESQANIDLGFLKFAANDVLAVVINAADTLFIANPHIELRRG